jgi:chemotaxis protein MotB
VSAPVQRHHSARAERTQADVAAYEASRRRSRRRPRAGDGAGGHEAAGMGRWLLTYSDMITLLLALFIILFAISTINAKKFLAFKMGITQSFNNVVQQTSHNGLLPSQNALSAKPTITTSMTAIPAKNPLATPRSTSSDLTKIQAELSRHLAAAGLSDVTSVSRTPQGVVVEIFADKAYFATDNATLEPIGDRVIDTIGGVLRSVTNHVEVQGYTDSQPITGGPYVSNWELSGARAAAAVVRLETVDQITPNRLSAVGFGTTHPVASNATAAGRAKNRRIDVVVLATTVPAPGTTSTATTSKEKVIVP